MYVLGDTHKIQEARMAKGNSKVGRKREETFFFPQVYLKFLSESF